MRTGVSRRTCERREEERIVLKKREEEPVGVAAVNRALSILDAFNPENQVLTLVELSQKTGLYKSTILRLLESLEKYGYVQRVNSGAYIIGVAPIRLAAVAKDDLHPAEKVMPVLRRLAEETRESASFYVRAGEQRLCAYRIDSPKSIRDHVLMGQLLPIHVGAAGRVLTRFGNATTPGTTIPRQALIVVSLGERDSEAAAVACPVFSSGQKLEGAVTLSGPIGRFTPEAIARMTDLLIHAARILTIGFRGNPEVFDEQTVRPAAGGTNA